MKSHGGHDGWHCLLNGGVLVLIISLLQASTTLASDISHPDITIHKIAFGSCHKSKYAIRHDLPTRSASNDDGSTSSSKSSSSSSSSIWDAIQQQDPDIFLWTGDAVYPPKRGIASVELLQQEYQQMLTNTSLGYTNFNPPHGIYGTWDDHDYGGNDMGNTMPDKPARAKAFTDFLQKKTLTTTATTTQVSQEDRRQGIYQSIEWGVAPRQVKVILLDTRWHRKSHCIPSVATHLPLGAGIACLTRWLTAGLQQLPIFCANAKRDEHAMLGKEQWEWLEQELSNTSQAQLHVIVSSIQVLTTNPAMESWGHYPNERRRLLQLLQQQQQNVVVLSGDVHHAEILNPTAYLDYDGNVDDVDHKVSPSPPSPPFLEITSSGLTHECSKHLYGRLCQPLLDMFSKHRYRNTTITTTTSITTTTNKDGDDDNDKKYYYIGRNYGMLEIDWEKQTWQVNVHTLETTTTASQHGYNQVVLTTGPRSFATTRQQQQAAEWDVDRVIPCVDGHLIPLFSKLMVTIIFLIVVSVYFLRQPQKQQQKQQRRRTKQVAVK